MKRSDAGVKNVAPVALVTGGVRGLGRAISDLLAESGYRVISNCLSSAEDMPETPLGAGSASIFRADVGRAGEAKLMARWVEANYGRLDAIVNNAGVARDSLLIRHSEKDWDEVMSVNLKGCFNVIREFAPIMIASGGGSIANISSYSGLKGKAGQAAYSASKAALLGLTFSAARELAASGIRVNAVLPGYMPTDMGLGAAKAMEAAREMSLLGTLSRPEDAARFIRCILETKTITGQVFSLESRIL